MRSRIPCLTCEGTRDYRATHCNTCRFLFNHPRKGTGVEKRISANGYVMLMVDNKQVYEHRFKMETKLGRRLRRKEHVHHKNGDKRDNRLVNLEILDESEHHKEHMTTGRAKAMSVLGHAARWGKYVPTL